MEETSPCSTTTEGGNGSLKQIKHGFFLCGGDIIELYKRMVSEVDAISRRPVGMSNQILYG